MNEPLQQGPRQHFPRHASETLRVSQSVSERVATATWCGAPGNHGPAKSKRPAQALLGGDEALRNLVSCLVLGYLRLGPAQGMSSGYFLRESVPRAPRLQ